MLEVPKYSGAGVYRIYNPINNMSYVGSSLNIKARMKMHIASFRHHFCNAKFMEDIQYLDYFKFEILEKIPADAGYHYLLEREAYYIWKYNSINCGYNMSIVYKKPYVRPLIEYNRLSPRKSCFFTNALYMLSPGKTCL